MADVVTAHRFVLVDNKGQNRAELAIHNDGACFTLTDEGGKDEATLQSRGLNFHHDNGSWNTSLDTSGISFLGPRDRILLSLISGTLLVLGERGKTEVSLSTSEDSARMIVSSGEFKTVIGNVDLVFPNSGEKRKTSAGTVVLFGKEGKVLWRTP